MSTPLSAPLETAQEIPKADPEVPFDIEEPDNQAIANLFGEILEAETRSYFEEPTRQFPGALPFDSPFRQPFNPDARRVSTPAARSTRSEELIRDRALVSREEEQEDIREEEEVLSYISHVSHPDPDATIQRIPMEALPRDNRPQSAPVRPARSPNRPNSPGNRDQTPPTPDRQQPPQEHPQLRPRQEVRQPEQRRAASMPARNSSSAPKFDSTNPRTLIRYFRELEILLDEARIDDPQLRKEHAMRYLDNDDYEIWDSLAEARRPYSYEEFRYVITSSYPGAEATRKYHIDDVTKLTDKWRRDGITTTQALGEYYREFRNITNYLIGQQRISEMEQRRKFVEGFSQDLLNRIAYKLQSAYPHVDPEAGFAMDMVYDAALSILRGSSFFRSDSTATSTRWDSSLPPITPYAASTNRAAPTTTLPANIKQEDLAAMIGKIVVQTLSNNASSVPPIAPQPPAANRYVPPTITVPGTSGNMVSAYQRRPPSDSECCNFCGEANHFMSSCPTADHYLRTGRIIRKEDGKLVLPSGMFVPRSIEGAWLKDRVDTWWQRQVGDQGNINPMPPQASTSSNIAPANPAAMYFSVEPSLQQIETSRGAFASVVSEPGDSDLLEEIEYRQQQILAIQAKQRTKKMVFDGVEIVKRVGPPTTRATAAKASNSMPLTSAAQPSVTVVGPPKDKGKEKAVEPASAMTQPASATPSSSSAAPPKPSESSQRATTSNNEAPTHPYEKAKDANYLPPVDRNFGAAPKPKERDAAYHTQAPIQDPKFVEIVLDRSLKDTHVTLSFEELLSISPDLHYKIRDKVTPKRQTATKHVSFAGEDEGDVEEVVSPATLDRRDLEPTKVARGKY